MIYLIIIFTILFLFLAWRRLDLALMLLIATMPAYLIRFNILGLPATLLEAMILTVFLVWFLKSYKWIFNNIKLRVTSCELRTVNRYPFDWEIVLLLFIALFAVGIADFSTGAFGIFKAYFFEPIMFFIVVLNVMKSGASASSPRPDFGELSRTELGTKAAQAGREKIFIALAVSALAVSILAIYQKITGQFIYNPLWAAVETRRVVSFFGYPNAVGLYLGPIILIMIGWLASVISNLSGNEGEKSFKDFFSFKGFLAFARNDKRKSGNDEEDKIPLARSAERSRRSPFIKGGKSGNEKIKIIFISLAIIMSVLSIYFAKSKGALFGVAVGIIVFDLLANKKVRRATVIILIIISLGIVVYKPARNLAVENITLTNLSGQIRKAGWRDSWKMLKDGRILTGAGLANFKASVEPYHSEGIFFKDYSDGEAQRKLVFNEAYRTAHWQPLEIYLYPHNIFLNFWSEIGLAGLLLFAWIILKYFWLGTYNMSLRGSSSDRSNLRLDATDQRLLRRAITRSLAMTDKYLVIGLICAMIVIVVHGLVDVPYFKNDLAVMFWLFVAMMSLIKLEKL